MIFHETSSRLSGQTTGSRQWTALAPAKLNLHLEVLGRRDDGFHEVETLLTRIRLYDTLSLKVSPEDVSTSTGIRLKLDPSSPEAKSSLAEQLPTDHSNLIIRAAERLAREAGIEPHGEFTLTKRIPMQAGMGGGSSNAAAALLLANQAWQLGYTREQLMPLAAELGSDAPFFLLGSGSNDRGFASAAVGRGRGELLEPVSGLPRLPLVIVKPAESSSTPEAYAKLNAPPVCESAREHSRKSIERLIAALRAGRWARAAQLMTNHLQQPVAGTEGRLHDLGHLLDRCGAIGSMMTGSGSAFFAFFRTTAQASQVAARVRSTLLRHRTLETVWTTST